jgi:hypothetical protein
MLDRLRIARYRFVLEAVEPMGFPPYRGSTLRGGLGHALKRIACQNPGGDCKVCPDYARCAYGYIFETRPPADSEVLRTHQAIPRPFVFEVQRDDKGAYRPGEEIPFGLVLIGKGIDHLPHFILAFKDLSEEGLGRGRGKFRLKGVWACDPLGPWEALIYDGESDTLRNLNRSIGIEEVEEAAAELSEVALTVHFRTPTRMKHVGEIVRQPVFHVLARNIIRRLSSLYYFHCGKRWETDYKGLIKRAKRVGMVDADLHWEKWKRHSGRRQRWIDMGGLLGDVNYAGPLADFRSLLVIGSLIHVGKKTVFGNGQFTVG